MVGGAVQSIFQSVLTRAAPRRMPRSMSTTFRLALAFALFPALARATDPPPPAPATGKVLVLANDRVIEGDVEKVGDQYRVRREGGETWLPTTQVRCVCADVDHAYRYLRGQANLDDGDERLRLARFCVAHGLRTQALAEADAALKLRPNHDESRRLLTALQHAPVVPPPSPSAAATAPEPEAPAPALDGAAFGQFVNRVQPVLMNACASCHATGRGGSFKLTRTYSEGGLTNRRATQQNLTAVLGMLNRDKPLESPLLTRAVAMHGPGEKPPLRGKTEPAYRSLEEWVQYAATAAPARETPLTVPPPAPEPKPVPESTPEKVVAPPTAAPPTAAAAPPRAAEPAPRPTPPPSPADTADPYDPAAFNRQARPEGGN